jgi:hypothetical protein
LLGLVFIASVETYLERRAAQTPDGGGLRQAWQRGPLSAAARVQRARARRATADTAPRERIQREIAVLGFDAWRAEQTVYDLAPQGSVKRPLGSRILAGGRGRFGAQCP